VAGNAPAPATLRSSIARVQRKFFPANAGNRSSRHQAFVSEYKEAFEADFASVESADFATVIGKLRRWKRILVQLVPSSGQTAPLHTCSRQLAQLHVDYNPWAGCSGTRGGGLGALEIPGLYQGADAEPRPDLHAKLQRFCPTLTFVTTYGQTHRRLALLGSDGRAYHFLVQFASPHATRAYERAIQLHTVANRMLDSDALAQRARLYTVTPVVVPITPRMRLQDGVPGSVTLQSVYESFCGAMRQDPDELVFKSRDRVQKASLEKSPEDKLNKLMELFRECSAASQTSNEALLRYLFRAVKDPNEVWVFRNKFAAQLGLTSMMRYALSGVEQTPQRLHFDPATGHVFDVDLRPAYKDDGSLDDASPVPFRLTANILTLLTPVIVDGVYTKAMVAGAGALVKRGGTLKPYLSLYLKDDLLSAQASKYQTFLDADLQRLDLKIRARTELNVAAVDDKLKKLAPKKPDAAKPPIEVPDRKVRALLADASSRRNLCRMDPAWMGWL